MIEKTDNSNFVNELSLCRHRTVSGRRCRLRVLNPDSHLCFRHAQLRQKKRHAADLAGDLAGQLTEFTSAADINTFLSRLLLLQAHDRIAPRRAAVMAYTANLLLRTLPAIYAEEGAAQDAPPHLIIDVPRPAYEEPDLPRPDPDECPSSDTSPDSRRGSDPSGPSSQAPAADERQPICRT